MQAGTQDSLRGQINAGTSRCNKLPYWTVLILNWYYLIGAFLDIP